MFGGRLRDEFEFERWTGSNKGPAAKDEAGDYWRKSRGSDRLLRWASLLYTGFFFIEPYFRHNLRHWLWFTAFYVAFLALYAGITLTHNPRLQKVLFVALFLLGFVYYPFNSSASGVFVFPVVMLAFVMRSARGFLIVLALQVTALAAETWLLHLAWWSTLMGIFFCLVIGLSNLSYSRQKRAAFLLNRANDEIEHLAQVAERERIARDLHDLLGHTLTVIAMKSELANRILPVDPARAAQEMREVEQTARQALAEVREAVTGYRSEGLATEVGRARKTLASSGVQMTTDLMPMALTASHANVLSLALREAVTNIVRHARASACSLRLMRDESGLRMVVVDNGVGSEGAEGNGLCGMRERVEALGGSMQRSMQPNGGTSLSVCLPLGSDSRVADLRTTGAPFSPLDTLRTQPVPWPEEQATA